MDGTPETRLRGEICLALGRASMCWSEIPKGVFRDVQASRIADELMETIEAYVDGRVSNALAIHSLSTTEIIRDGQGNEIARSK